MSVSDGTSCSIMSQSHVGNIVGSTSKKEKVRKMSKGFTHQRPYSNNLTGEEKVGTKVSKSIVNCEEHEQPSSKVET